MRSMEKGADTSQLIRKLSRRQWLLSLAVVALVLGSLALGWRLIANNQEAAEIINLAGRQRMLSQRMAMFLVLRQNAAAPDRERQYREMSLSAASDFDEAHERLAATAQKLGSDSAIHALYFGPAGTVNADSRRYLSLVRKSLAASDAGKPHDDERMERILAEAGSGLIKGLDEVTRLYQRQTEQQVQLILRLQLISAALIISLLAAGMFRIFRPVINWLAQDVAARDRAQNELKESEERFKSFSESSSDWFWQTDTDDRFSWISVGNNVKTPLPLKQVLGKTRLELRPDVEIAATEKWAAYQADIAARHTIRDFEYQTVGETDGTAWVAISGQPFFDDAGNFLGYRGTAKYIQERKEIEAALLRLQIAIEQSPISIMIIDSRTRIIFVNKQFTATSGYSLAEALGRRPKSLIDSGKTPEAVFAAMARTLAEGRNWRGELCCRKKNGDLYWENLSVSPVKNSQERVTHYIAVSEDITEQRRQRRREQDHNRILEAIANGVPLQETLQLMVVMTEAELAGALCVIQRLDRVTGKLHRLCNSSALATFAEKTDGLPIGPNIASCGTAAFTATRVVVDDINNHPDWQPWRDLAATAGVRACWSQPILSSSGLVLGTIDIYHRSARTPVADAIQVMELVSSLAAICLERHEAEQALRRQEEQTRQLLVENETILGNAMVGIVYLKHRRVVSCNRRLEEIFGYEPGELIGSSSAVFYASRKTFDAVGIEAYQVAEKGRSFNSELMLRRKDGSVFRGALTGRAVDPAQPQEGSIWVYADISERYHAEQEAHKLLQALEQSPVSIVITNREGIIEYVNPRFTRVTGYSSREAVGQNPRILQSGETAPEIYKELWQALLAGGEWHGVLRNRRKNGELFWEEASISPIIDDMNQVTHFLAVKEDITERKQIEDELEQHREQLENLVAQRTADLMAALDAAKAADRAKDAFLAHVSHELRTPLNAVIGLSELARRLSTDPRQQDFLDKVTGAGRSLAGIINDLLDLSKISAGRLEFENISFSLRGLIQRSLSVMSHRADEKGLALRDHIDDAVPDVLLGDPLRIEQILLNLLSNAIKFTPAGSVDLRIRVDRITEGRARLSLEVEDTGIGLSEESLSRLFQPFAQADASMNRKFGGTGLGLVLCRRLAEMMDGDINVTSREGFGTTFHVMIWLSLGDTGEVAATSCTANTEALPLSYRDARVLVVDDQPLNREIVEALLDEVGIETQFAGNGKEAVDILESSGPHAFDLVLMDIQMPVMDGLTATRTIRGQDGFGELPIIAMTAHTMEHEKEISAGAGMSDHIGKPFETASFFRVLARWIPVAKQQAKATAGARQPAAVGAGDTVAIPEKSQRQPVIQSPAQGLAALSSIDTQAGLNRFAGNETRYRHWLATFLAEAPGYAAQIRRVLTTDSSDAARQAAHAIKGRVGMLGMTTLHPIAAALEETLMQGRPADALLERMQTEVEYLCQDIRNALGTAEPEPVAASVVARLPAGPMPQSLTELVAMLQCADGNSVEAIERCLVELQGTDWVPRLQLARTKVANFDFDAACALLVASTQAPTTGTDA